MGQASANTSLGGIVAGFLCGSQRPPIGDHRPVGSVFLLLGQPQVFPGCDTLRHGSPGIEIRRGGLQAPFVRIRQETIFPLIRLRGPQRLRRRLPSHAYARPVCARQEQAAASQYYEYSFHPIKAVLDKDKYPSALLVRPMAQKNFHCGQKSLKMSPMEDKKRH